MKKFLCCFLAAVTIVSAVPAFAFAEEAMPEAVIETEEEAVVEEAVVEETEEAVVEEAAEEAVAEEEGDEAVLAGANGLVGEVLYINGVRQYTTGLTKVNGTWYYLKNGAVYAAGWLQKNAYGWWKIGSNGQIDFRYNGIGQNAYGTWYVRNGKVDTSVNGLIKVNGTWYFFKNGKVSSAGWLQKNQYGWWKIGSNGQIDFNFTGMAQNQYGWFFVRNGKVDTSYTGVSQNAYGRWHIKKGALDRSYNGIDRDLNGNVWYMRNGQVQTNYTGSLTISGSEYDIVNGRVKNCIAVSSEFGIIYELYISNSTDSSWRRELLGSSDLYQTGGGIFVGLQHCNMNETVDIGAQTSYGNIVFPAVDLSGVNSMYIDAYNRTVTLYRCNGAGSLVHVRGYSGIEYNSEFHN